MGNRDVKKKETKKPKKQDLTKVHTSSTSAPVSQPSLVKKKKKEDWADE